MYVIPLILAFNSGFDMLLDVKNDKGNVWCGVHLCLYQCIYLSKHSLQPTLLQEIFGSGHITFDWLFSFPAQSIVSFQPSSYVLQSTSSSQTTAD